MIYTLTLNPALDYVLRLPTLREGATNRAESAALRFGGKGINVSCILRELGMETRALGFAAGFTGEALEAELTQRGIPTSFIHLSEGLTRINVKVSTQASETEINGVGPVIPPEAIASLYEQLDSLTHEDTLVLAGSIPPSLPSDLYGCMGKKMAERGIRFVVDAEGNALAAALPYRPFLVKPNRAELEALMGHPLPTEESLRAAALSLQQAGAVNILVSLGDDGAMLLDEYGNFHQSTAPQIHLVSAVGAGDSMVAGFLAGCAGSPHDYERALRFGIAAGSATAASDGLANRAAIARLME